jgi:hypothetical protein
MASDHEDLRTIVRMRCGKTGAVTLALFTRSETIKQFRIEKVWESTGDSEQPAGQGAGPGSNRYSTNQFDWSGWYCPSCGHDQDGKALYKFALCGGCRELVCGYSIREVGPGIQTFKCFCGAGGRLTGNIDSYEGQSAAKSKALASNADFKALPPSKHS